MNRGASQSTLDGVQILAPVPPELASVLSPAALEFVARLQREFNPTRKRLLEQRVERQARLDAGEKPDFLAATAAIRADSTWQVAPTPPDLQKRRVEITGPTDRKMLINALNSGASVFMADFEDANAPTWSNMLEGQRNLTEAIERTLEFTSPEGKHYHLQPNPAVLLVRPRGWHLPEKHLWVDNEPVSGSLFDFGLYFFHNTRSLIERGTAPYFYLPKLESHLEARLWNDVFNFAQDALAIPRGTLRATVLIETILAAFEMEEILYELRQHASGLNAGRWDYIFSIIKKFCRQPDVLLPDRSQVSMTVPFMRAYTRRLVQTCHRRGAHAMGGMAAFIPSRKDAQVNENALSKVREDKLREAQDGFDGTWVAHPDLVPVAMQVFDEALGERPHQKDHSGGEQAVTAADLTNFHIPGGEITENGLRHNISVALQYLESWLRGVGAVAIYNLMEDAATAEISRAQLWQWLHHPQAGLTPARYAQLVTEELEKIRTAYGEDRYQHSRFAQATRLLDSLVLSDDFADFLTLAAYDQLE